MRVQNAKLASQVRTSLVFLAIVVLNGDIRGLSERIFGLS